jgi:hypothetical protein
LLSITEKKEEELIKTQQESPLKSFIYVLKPSEAGRQYPKML